MAPNPLGAWLDLVRGGAICWLLAALPLALVGCAPPAAPRVAPGSPLGPPELMTCHKLGQFLICNPVLELASE